MRFDYPKNVYFKCLCCALCCGDTKNRNRTILLMQIEANQIKQKTSTLLEKFTEKVSGCEPYVYKMKKTDAGRCVFLKDDLCTIYTVRPLICRFYPFELKGNESGRYSFMFTEECPGIGKGQRLERRFFEKLFKDLVEQMNKNRSIAS